MKKIEAIIKPFKLSLVKEALHEVGISGMTVSDVKGFGRQRGSTGGIEKENSYDDEFLAKMKLEVIVEDSQVNLVIESIKTAAYSRQNHPKYCSLHPKLRVHSGCACW